MEWTNILLIVYGFAISLLFCGLLALSDSINELKERTELKKEKCKSCKQDIK